MSYILLRQEENSRKLTFRRYMPPNTPHWVLTVSHAICHGGHFYSSGSIRETAVALYRAFTSGGHLTNTTHAASRVLLRRLGFFWHSNIVLGENRGSGMFFPKRDLTLLQSFFCSPFGCPCSGYYDVGRSFGSPVFLRSHGVA